MKLITLALILALSSVAEANWRRAVHNFCTEHLVADDPDDFAWRVAEEPTEQLIAYHWRLVEDLRRPAGNFKELRKESWNKGMLKAIKHELFGRGVILE